MDTEIDKDDMNVDYFEDEEVKIGLSNSERNCNDLEYVAMYTEGAIDVPFVSNIKVNISGDEDGEEEEDEDDDEDEEGEEENDDEEDIEEGDADSESKSDIDDYDESALSLSSDTDSDKEDYLSMKSERNQHINSKNGMSKATHVRETGRLSTMLTIEEESILAGPPRTKNELVEVFDTHTHTHTHTDTHRHTHTHTLIFLSTTTYFRT